MQAMRARGGAASVVLAAALWGTVGPTAGSLHLAPVQIGFVRLLVGAALLQPFIRHRPAPSGSVTAAVGAGLALYQVAYFAAIDAAGVAVATVVALGLAPALVAVSDVLRFRRVPELAVIGALLLCLVGLVVLTSGASGPHPLRGAVIALASAAGFAYVAVVAGAQEPGQSLALTGRAFVVGAVALLPFAGLAGVPTGVDGRDLALLLWLGAAPTAVAYAAYLRAVPDVGATLASLVALLEPLTAAALAALLLGEPLSGRTVLGGAILLGGMVLAMTGNSRRVTPTRLPPSTGAA